MKLIDESKFQLLIDAEKKVFDTLEPGTLDWYTYKNRIKLLSKVEDLFQEVEKPKKTAKKEVKQAEDKD